MIYALIGIPVTLIFLANVGQFITEGGKLLASKCYRLISQRLLRKMQDPEDVELPPIGGMFITAFILYTTAGAGLFYLIEDDTDDFLSAFYFVFTSLTTIGFGDFYPKK